MGKVQLFIIKRPIILFITPVIYSKAVSVSGNFQDFTIVGTAANASLKIAKIIEIPKLCVNIYTIKANKENNPQIKSNFVIFQ